jgi:hypothetical protein
MLPDYLIRRRVCLVIAALALFVARFLASAGSGLGLQTDIVFENPGPGGGFPLEASRQAAPIVLDAADWPGVLRAGADLQADVERVTGMKPALARFNSQRTLAVFNNYGVRSFWVLSSRGHEWLNWRRYLYQTA